MTIGVILCVCIIVVALILRFDWRPSRRTTSPTPSRTVERNDDVRPPSNNSSKSMGSWVETLIIIAVAVCAPLWMKSCMVDVMGKIFAPTPTTYIINNTPAPTRLLDFPKAGEGPAKRGVGLKAYINPQKTYTRPSGPAKYVLATNPDVFFNDTAGENLDHQNNKQWWSMPAGEYFVYPLKEGVEEIYFRWWQK